MKIIQILILTTLLACGNIFANSIATVTAIKGFATVQRDGKSIQITLGIKLEEKDNIITKDNSKLQIIFNDETIISIGKNSNFSIKEYVFEDKQEPVAKFGMLKGAMRTITGKIGKIAPEKFSVVTKTATIGIRGTNFSVVVGNDGSYNAFCTYGAISVSIKGQEHIVKQGYFISITPTGKSEVKEFTPANLKKMKKENFGSTQAKITKTSKDDSNENNEQLNVTIEDDSGIILKDISDSITDSVQSDSVGITDSSIIAGYSMSNAVYTGSFTGTSSGSFDTSGDAKLEIDFGGDTATLTLSGLNGVNATYDSFTGLNTNTISAQQTNNLGGATDASFYNTTGNNVQGSYSYGEYISPDNVITANGTYDVSTSQTLH